MTDDLGALQAIDFEWTTHIDSIWRDLPYDVPGLQETLRREAMTMLDRLFASSSRASPLGLVVMGPGGSGKTHLLSLLRGAVLQRNAFFVLVDMTDVREFWDITLLGFIRSLTQGQPTQQERLIRGLVELAGGPTTFEKLRSGRPPKLINACNGLIAGLRQKFPELHEHQDVLRALVLLGSDDNDILDLGWKWLQAIGIDEGEKFMHGFNKSIGTPREIVKGLSFLMSLCGPTLLALDQLDAIVAELQLVSAAAPSDASGEIDPRQAGALAIIQGIAKGLIALRDTTSRTQTLVACLEQTWHALDKRALVTMVDRFMPPLLLKPVTNPQHVQELIEQRIVATYQQQGFVPPYPTYPYRPAFFASLRGLSPRAVLKRCDEHRWLCLRRGEVLEADVEQPLPPGDSFGGDFDEARRELEVLAKQADVERMLQDEDEDALDKLLETACRALVMENPVPEDIDVPVDLDFVGSAAYVPLHARIRVVYRSEAEREKHYAVRFLQKSNHIAFQARLKAAMTASGIDHDLSFRRLTLFRCGPVPGGPTTARLLEELRARGGALLEPTLEELRTLWALCQMLALGSTAVLIRDWLRSERIVSHMPMFADAASYLFSDAPKRSHAPPRPSASAGDRLSSSEPALRSGSISLQPEPGPGAFDDGLLVGRKLIAGKPKETVELPLANLANHTVVLAGAGAGKTVLVRRIVEEAVLLGVPSIVIDGANDLVRLSDAWPETPESFSSSDRAKAERYARTAEVVIWTPGREANPLLLEPLPDFSEVAGDREELQVALDMARTSLDFAVGGGKAADKKRAVLAGALRYFAKLGGGTLSELCGLLRDLPAEANVGFEKAGKLARELGESILAEIEINPLLRGQGTQLDPAKLFQSRRSDKVRVSVINLSGLPDQAAQQQFVNQLATTLFIWIKKHPARDRALSGLLVVDEARDFVPSGKTVPGKDSLLRLTAQGRKYGLGMLFATQSPKGIDHNAIANCSTQFYGRANSPAALETVQAQLQQRGGGGGDVAKLERGQFYVYSEGMSAPLKIATPLCLTHHPPNPPDESEIVRRAVASRSLV